MFLAHRVIAVRLPLCDEPPSNPNPRYRLKNQFVITCADDEISKRVNEEISALGDDGTFSDFKMIDKRLGRPRGTNFEMGGYSDYFAYEERDKKGE
jgi:hypothetical protein